MTIDELLALNGLTGSDEIPVWDAEESGEPTKKITAANLAAAIKALASLLGTGDVVNNLVSTATDKPGSANMLKTLNDKIEKIKIRTGSKVITVNANSTYDLNDESFGVTMPSVPSVFINGQLGENAQYIDMKVSWVSTTAFWAKIKNTHSQSVGFTLYWAAISFVA